MNELAKAKLVALEEEATQVPQPTEAPLTREEEEQHREDAHLEPTEADLRDYLTGNLLTTRP